ncbi:Mbeg1-like protein [Paenibacillus sp. DYY-L-2]|uniref:Mbeg1-like protein n=1 Tax=Paenibacillus sp. DYY-L-2 TaxID=3447013 RepID=UPI003F4F7144
MAALNDSQLILLDNLIYLKNVANRNDISVGEIVRDLIEKDLDLSKDQKTDKYPGSMSRTEWIDILKAIEQDPQLTNLTVQYGDSGYVYDQSGRIVLDADRKTPLEAGARTATFVDLETEEAVVVFRGTSGDLEWHDNGTGGYLSDTEMQKRALDYIESLPYDNLTVTGHSKGGNKAQYVGILSDKVKRVVSLDGQGFSQEFMDKFKDRIAANQHKITSISAGNDPVNSLLIPIASTIRYIKTSHPRNPLDLFYYHKPNIVLNEHGILNEETNQGIIPRFIHEFSVFASATMKEPFRRYTFDGLLGFLEKGNQGSSKESLGQSLFSVIMAISQLDNLAFSKINEKGGRYAELAAAATGTVIFPYIFADDLLRSSWRNLNELKDYAIEKAEQFGEWLDKTMAAASEKFKELGTQFGEAFSAIAEQLKAAMESLIKEIGSYKSSLENAVKSMIEAIDRFKDNVIQEVSDFGNHVIEGMRNETVSLEDKSQSNSDLNMNKELFSYQKCRNDLTALAYETKDGAVKDFCLKQIDELDTLIQRKNNDSFEKVFHLNDFYQVSKEIEKLDATGSRTSSLTARMELTKRLAPLINRRREIMKAIEEIGKPHVVTLNKNTNLER